LSVTPRGTVPGCYQHLGIGLPSMRKPKGLRGAISVQAVGADLRGADKDVLRCAFRTYHEHNPKLLSRDLFCARCGAAAPGRSLAAPGRVRLPTRILIPRNSSSSTRPALPPISLEGMGRRRPGRRLRAAVPHGHDKTITLVAGLAPSRACGPEGLRPADERRPVRGMGGEMSRSNPSIAISAALEPGHEPDREGFYLRKARRANRRWPDEGARSLRRHLQIRRMPK
jgi:hypothetical protein